MKKFSKIFAVGLMVLMLTMAFAGCGGGTGLEEEDPNKINIRLSFTKAGFGTTMYDNLEKKFEAENPDINLILEGSYTMGEVISSRIEGNTMVSDIFEVPFMGIWQKLAVKGYLEDLTDFYGEEIENGMDVHDKLMDGVKDYGRLGEQYYAIPAYAGVTGFLYNVTMFEENGWQVPKTTKELLDLCDAMVKKGVTPLVYCGKVAGGYWDFPVQGWWFQYEGADKIDEFFEFASPEVFKQEGRLKGLEMYSKLAVENAKYTMKGCSGKDNIQAQADFIQGKAAMIPCASYFETEMREDLEAHPDFKVAMMPLPFISDDQGNILAKKDADGNPIRVNNTMAENGYIIPKNAKNKEAAKRFLKFLLKEESLQSFTRDTNTPMPYNYDVSVVSAQASDFAKSCFEIWENSVNIFGLSNNPMSIGGKLGVWPRAGFHYSRIYDGVEDPYGCYIGDYNYVSKNWESFKAEVGM